MLLLSVGAWMRRTLPRREGERGPSHIREPLATGAAWPAASVAEGVGHVGARHADDDRKQAMEDADRARLLVRADDVVEAAVDERALVDVTAAQLERMAGLAAERVEAVEHHRAADRARPRAPPVSPRLRPAHDPARP